MAEFKFKAKEKHFNSVCSNQLVFDSVTWASGYESHFVLCEKETCVDPTYSGGITDCEALWTPAEHYPGYDWTIRQVWASGFTWNLETDYYDRFYDTNQSGVKIGDNQTFMSPRPLSFGGCPSGTANNFPWRIEENSASDYVYGSGTYEGNNNWTITWSGGGDGYCRRKYFTTPSRLGWEDCGTSNYIHAVNPWEGGIDVSKDLKNDFDFVGDAGGACDDVYTERNCDIIWRMLGEDGIGEPDLSGVQTVTLKEILLDVDPQPSVDTFVHYSGGPSAALNYWVGYSSVLFPNIGSVVSGYDEFERSSIYNVSGFTAEDITGREYNRDDANPDTDLLELLDLDDFKVGASPPIGQIQYNRACQTDTLAFSDGDFTTQSMVEHCVENSTQYKIIIDKVSVSAITERRIMRYYNVLNGEGFGNKHDEEYYVENDHTPGWPASGTTYRVLINTTTGQVDQTQSASFVRKDHKSLASQEWLIAPLDYAGLYSYPGPAPFFGSGTQWTNAPDQGWTIDTVLLPASGDLQIYCDVDVSIEYRVFLDGTDYVEAKTDGNGRRLIGVQRINPGGSGGPILAEMYEYDATSPPFPAYGVDSGGFGQILPAGSGCFLTRTNVSYLFGPCENELYLDQVNAFCSGAFFPHGVFGGCTFCVDTFEATATLQDRQGGDWPAGHWNSPDPGLANQLCVENSGHHAHKGSTVFVSGLGAGYDDLKTYKPDSAEKLEAESDLWKRIINVPSVNGYAFQLAGPKTAGKGQMRTWKSTSCCMEWGEARKYFDPPLLSGTGWTSVHDENIQYSIPSSDGELLSYCRESNVGQEDPNDFGKFVWTGKSKHFVPRGCNDLKWDSNQSQFPWISPSGRLDFGVRPLSIFTEAMCGTTTTPSRLQVPAQPVVHSYSSNATTFATSITLNKPNGTTSGDLLVALLGSDGSPAGLEFSLAGWNTVGHFQHNDIATSVLWKFATGSEPSSYTFTHNKTNTLHASILMRISGADPTTPINAFGSDTIGGPSTTIAIPDITTTVDGCLMLQVGNHDYVGTPWVWNDPDVDAADTINEGLNGAEIGVGWKTLVTGGSSGSETISVTLATNQYWTGVHLAIAPRAGSGY